MMASINPAIASISRCTLMQHVDAYQPDPYKIGLAVSATGDSKSENQIFREQMSRYDGQTLGDIRQAALQRLKVAQKITRPLAAVGVGSTTSCVAGMFGGVLAATCPFCAHPGPIAAALFVAAGTGFVVGVGSLAASLLPSVRRAESQAEEAQTFIGQLNRWGERIDAEGKTTTSTVP